jgi:hypothetical protein
MERALLWQDQCHKRQEGMSRLQEDSAKSTAQQKSDPECHAPIFGYRGNVNLSAKNILNGSVHLQPLDLNFLFYYFCLLINIYNALNLKKIE